MTRLPTVFVSHGAPTIAIEEDDPFHAALRAYAAALPRPRAVAIVSAHWEMPEPVRATASERPTTIHDYTGFPVRLNRIAYPCPGDPALAGEIANLTGGTIDSARGLDHGAWVPLRSFFPDADVPVVQVSLPLRDPAGLFELGQRLEPLRSYGVLLIASGGMVHNLGRLVWNRKVLPPEPWAAEFDRWMRDRIGAGDVASLLAYRETAPHAARAHPTAEHLHPLFVALGAAPRARVVDLHDAFHYATLGMRCLALE